MKNFDSENEIYLRDTIELYPTQEQFEKINRFIDLNRSVWNQFIEYQDKALQERNDGLRKYGWLDKNEMVTYMKKYEQENPEILEVPANTRIRMVNRTELAQIRYVKGIANKPKKHDSDYKRSFDPRSGHGLYFDKDSGTVQIEGIGKIPCQYRDYDKIERFKSANITVSNRNKVYLSVAYITEKLPFDYEKTDVLGIDLGSRADNSNTIVCSDGTRYCQPDVTKIDNTIKRLQRRCKKMQTRRNAKSNELNIDVDSLPYSKNEQKLLDRYHKALERKHNVLNTFYDQATADIVKKNPAAIVIEHNNAKKIKADSPYIHSDRVYYGSIMEKMQYKTNMHDIPYEICNNGYPASKLCSVCGNKNDPGSSQTYRCQYCGCVIDRDDNASINLTRIYNEQNDSFRIINGNYRYTRNALQFGIKHNHQALYFN